MKRRDVGKYFTRREARYFEDSDFDEDGHLKEDGEADQEEFTDQSFLAHAEHLNAGARAFLREQRMPDCRGVSFPPGAPEEWEACEEFPASLLKPRHINWSPLDSYLRSYRGVRDDEPEDLAARIVCTAYRLKHAVNNDAALWLAHELGELATLFHIYTEEDRRRQKPRPAKRLAWADAAADKRVGTGTSDRERWEIPEDFEVFAAGRRWYVSRAEDKKGVERLLAYDADDEHPEHQWGPAYRNFRDRYLRAARKRRVSRRGR